MHLVILLRLKKKLNASSDKEKVKDLLLTSDSIYFSFILQWAVWYLLCCLFTSTSLFFDWKYNTNMQSTYLDQLVTDMFPITQRSKRAQPEYPSELWRQFVSIKTPIKTHFSVNYLFLLTPMESQQSRIWLWHDKYQSVRMYSTTTLRYK